MADFDPSKPIDDPQVWFPKGMFIGNKAQQLTINTLYDLFEDDKQSIPLMLLEKRQLETIVHAWNDLKTYASDYIEHAFMTNDPEQVTIQEYVKQLDNAVD
ncbi:hypothetical protein Trihar35433_2695 [Trichoderma harzianum]|nr:hypothetical protein Trihar35433_2695 [Trichoderma harzianum]